MIATSDGGGSSALTLWLLVVDWSGQCKLVMSSLAVLIALHAQPVPYTQADTTRYLAEFSTLVAASYSQPLPAALAAACRSRGAVDSTLPEVSISGTVTAAQATATCGDAVCVISASATLRMTGSLNVGALIVRGLLLWDDTTQAAGASEQWLCAGYVAIEPGGVANISLPSRSMHGVVYIKDNGLAHPVLGTRAFGGYDGVVSIRGSPLRRTFSLLAQAATIGARSIVLLHDPAAMGWAIGDRIALAPTTSGSRGSADACTITGFGPGNMVQLSTALAAAYSVSLGHDAIRSAEVVHLSRNMLISGDDLSHVPCSGGATCTHGLHTIGIGSTHVQRVEYTRVEKCGQRGSLGRYCLHFHLQSRCPSCYFRGNAIEHGHQRGIVIHGTHQARVEENVIFGVRGAGIYVEDGNEMGNVISHNVVICPWSREGPLRGCTVPGTDNAEADTVLNQAGLWALPTNNHIIGNRFANSFNGLFFQSNFAGGVGRGHVLGQLCTEQQPFGRVQGNTCHGHGRFGTYLLGPNFPRSIDASVSTGGVILNRSSCDAFQADGTERGVSVVLADNTDYQVVFVGQYDAGDVQYLRHTSVNNNNLIYWKTTKPFTDGCSAHISSGRFADGTMALPDQAAFIIERTNFGGDTTLESNHHCNVGVTGMLCQPTYVLDRVVWASTAARWMWFTENGNGMRGGIFVLAPPEQANTAGHIFPAGYCALAAGTYTYLLQIRGPSGAADVCVTAASLGLGTRYDNGILCKRPLRALKLYTRGLSHLTARRLLVEMRQGGTVVTQAVNFHRIGTTRKQGYSLPVLPMQSDFEHAYYVSLEGGGVLDTAWIIEFSDVVFGHRWAADVLRLSVAGRTCPELTTSQHDRRFLWAGVSDSDHLGPSAWGRGACTTYSDMPHVYCALSSSSAGVPLPSCDECERGDGPESPCAKARCGTGGVCVARWLGGSLAVSRHACACNPPWTGPRCDQDPCAARNVTCSGRGMCVGYDDASWRCECAAGYSGLTCEHDCATVCPGEHPFGCNPSVDAPFHFCAPNGNCAYVQTEAEAAGRCPYKWTSACASVRCEAADDCQLAGACDEATATCGAPTQLTDGTACNSVEDGVCMSGVCQLASPPPPLLPPLPPPSSPLSPSPPRTTPTSPPCPTPSPTPPPFPAGNRSISWADPARLCLGSNACIRVIDLALVGGGAAAMCLCCTPLVLCLCCRLRALRRDRKSRVLPKTIWADSFAETSVAGRQSNGNRCRVRPENGRSSVAIALPAGARVSARLQHARRSFTRRSRTVTDDEVPLQPAMPHAPDMGTLPPPPANVPPPLALPTGWEAFEDDHGQPYFYNEATGESTWERPEAAMTMRQVARC